MIAFFLNFWLYHPALLYGSALLMGILCYLGKSPSLIIPCLFLWLPFLINIIYSRNQETFKFFALSLTLFFSAWLYTASHHVFPHLPSEGLKGIAYVKINNINLQSSPFAKNLRYRCELTQFFPNQSSKSIVSSLPCYILFPANSKTKSIPLANQDYWVPGKLKQNDNGAYVLKVSTKSTWTPIAGTWSWAEQRFLWKKKISKWIESQFSQHSSAIFLGGLVTGEFDDYWMRDQFARFGLLHLLAISGFHFAIIAGFLSMILRFILPLPIRTIGLLLCLGAYCFLLGPQPSILRAWIMCSLTLLGGLLQKQTTALNSVGFALLIILGYNPLLCQELGFQLSFAITVAILLFYQPALAFVHFIFPKRSLSDALQMNGWNQHAYCVLAFFKQALALTLAVNVFAIPLTLYYFQQFPWMSLLYNLFFPFLASISLCLLLLGGMLTFVPFIAAGIHYINDRYTFFLLQLTYQIPSELDAHLSIGSIHSVWIALYLCGTCLCGILWKEKNSQNLQEKPFAFI